MSPIDPSGRRDVRRNRERLIAAATQAYTSGEDRVPLETIAKDAGVGIATLYRHFPTREDLVEAMYRDQVERLGAGADELLTAYAPAEALRRWMDLFADWAAAKHGMIDALRAVVFSGRLGMGEMREHLVAVVRLFLDAGAAAGDLRSDVAADDVAASLAGVLAVAGAPEQRAQAMRMFDLLIDGLRPAARP